MKLAIFDVSRFDAQLLEPWCADAGAVNLAIMPLADSAWRNPPVNVLEFESIADRHVALFEPLLKAGASDEGPRLPGAKVSFVGAADFTLYFESRFHLTLLLSAERLLRQHAIDRIEYVTDAAYGDRYYDTVRSFAAFHGLPCRRVRVGNARLDLPRRAAQVLDSAAYWCEPFGPPIADYLRAVIHRRGYGQASRQAPVSLASRSTSGKTPIRAAMLVYHSKSWRFLLPIRARLLELGHEVLLISPRAECDRALEQAGVRDFISLPPRLPSAAGLRQATRWLEEMPWNPDSELAPLVGRGKPLTRVVARLGGWAYGIYANVAQQLPALLNQHGINVVLGTDSGSVAARCFYRTAEHMNIEPVFVQHGAIYVGANVAHYMLNTQRLVWGQSTAENMLRCGVAGPDRIHVLGSPFHEERYASSEETDANGAAVMVLVTYGVPGGYVPEGEFQRAASAVFSAALQLPHVRFVVKPHPGDPGHVWRQLAEQYPTSNVEILELGDTYSLMPKCRVLVTMFSTTGAEAIWLGKPVVSVNPCGRETGLDYLAAGAAYTVADPDLLGPLLRSLLEAPTGEDSLAATRAQFAESFLHREPRRAVDRAIDLLQHWLRARSERETVSCQTAGTADLPRAESNPLK